jgi:hypothetical protein
MRAQEIREAYLSFFAAREHKIVPSASLVLSVNDPSVLLTTAAVAERLAGEAGELSGSDGRMVAATGARLRGI